MKPVFFKNELFLTALTGVVVLLMILFNDINREIRLKELKVFLQKTERADNSLDHIGLVMRYRINKRLYENQMTDRESDLVELRVNSLLADSIQKKRIPVEQYRIVAVPAVYTINFFRFLIGKPPIRDISDAESENFLEIAYYYERNKLYDKAREIYDKALTAGGADKSATAGMFLHRGFCHSIIGNYKEAKADYTTVIKDYSDEKSAITAVILLRYLEGFRSEAVRVLKDEKDSVGKGEKLYKLIAYRESLQVLDKVEKSASPEEISRIRLVKAKCFEEIAEKEKAINTYQKIIKEDRNSEYAKTANRRMFIIGSLANNGARVKEMAVMNNEVIEDETFGRMISQVEKIERTKEPAEEQTGEKALAGGLPGVEEKAPVIDESRIDSLEGITAEKEKGPEKKRVKKSEKKKPLKKEKIHTTDGNIFVGSILDDTGEAVTMQTMIGRVVIEKKRILKRERM